MLKTEFLGLNYHADVENNTDEVDAEEYFNKNYFIIDANAKKNYEDLAKLKEDLQQENTELAQQMPWNQVSGKSIHITDSAKYSKNKLEISGNLEETLADSTQEKSTSNPATINMATGVQKIRQFRKNYFDLNDKKTVDSLFTADTEDCISVTYNNSTGTTVKYINYMTKPSSKIETNTNYALFLEVKSVSGTGGIYLTSEIANEKIQFNNAIAVNFSSLSSNKIYKYTITSKTDLTDTAITTMLRSFIRFNAGENGSITFRISVIEDTSVTTENFVYEPYWEEINTLDLESTELCAIKDINGNVVAKDREVYRNGKWQWEKKIWKYVFDGTETITLRTNSSTTHTKFIFSNILPYKISSTLSLICSHFVANTANSAEISTNCICSNNASDYKKYIYISVENEVANTIDKMKAYLLEQYNAGTPVTIYFILETPIYEDCTAEQSAVLDKLYNNFALQKGVNNVIVESENGVGVEMQLDYMQDLQTKLNLLEAMCVSNASQEV